MHDRSHNNVGKEFSIVRNANTKMFHCGEIPGLKLFLSNRRRDVVNAIS